MDEDEKGAGMSPLREAAIQLHELYAELKAAGFSRGEAMELVAKMATSTINQTQDDDN